MDDKPCKYFHDTVSSCIIHICEILLLCPWFALMLVAVAIAKFEVKMIWASVFRDNPRPSPWASSSKDHRVNDPPGKRSHIPNPRRFSLSIGGMFQQIIDFQQQWKGLVNFHGELEDVWGPNPCSSNGNTCTKRKGDIADLSEWRHNVEGNGISTPPETYGRLLSHPQFPCVLKIKLQKLWTQHGIQSIFCTIKYMKIWNIEYKYIMYNIYHSSWQLSIIAKKNTSFFWQPAGRVGPSRFPDGWCVCQRQRRRQEIGCRHAEGNRLQPRKIWLLDREFMKGVCFV